MSKRTINFDGESFEDPDDVVARRHQCSVSTVLVERRRRGIRRVRSATLQRFEEEAPRPAPQVAPSGGGYTVNLGGVEVRCATLADLTALLQQQQAAPAVASPPPGTPSIRFGTCWRAPAAFGGCTHQAPVLASGKPATVCHLHASQATKDRWKHLETLHGQSTVFPLPGMTVDDIGVSVRSKKYGFGSGQAAAKSVPPPASPRPAAPPPVVVQPAPSPAPPRVVVGGTVRPTRLTDVEAAPVRWLWQNRIPAGMLTVLYAPPGIGKGTLTATLAAAVTRGSALPDDGQARTPGSALFLVAEDDPSLTVRPRLDAAGADPDRVHVFGPEARLRLPKHTAELEMAVRETEAALVVVDPLRGLINGDSRKQVREALVGLEGLAARTGAAVLVIHHTNKAGGVLGSQDIVGIPRSLLFVEWLDGVLSLTQAKKNLAPDAPPVYFRVVERQVGQIRVGAVEWAEPPAAEPATAPEPPGQRYDCKQCRADQSRRPVQVTWGEMVLHLEAIHQLPRLPEMAARLFFVPVPDVECPGPSCPCLDCVMTRSEPKSARVSVSPRLARLRAYCHECRKRRPGGGWCAAHTNEPEPPSPSPARPPADEDDIDEEDGPEPDDEADAEPVTPPVAEAEADDDEEDDDADSLDEALEEEQPPPLADLPSTVDKPSRADLESAPDLVFNCAPHPDDRITDPAVLAEMVASVEGFVYSKALKHVRRLTPGGALSLDDLVSVGRMGALVAARRFDAERGFQFITYAGFWIEHTIRREIENCNFTIRVPVHLRKFTERDTARFKGSNALVRLSQNGGVSSLDAKVGDDFDAGDHHELVADDAPSVEALLMNGEQAAFVKSLVKRLPPTERKVIVGRFYKKRPLREVGEQLSLSRERVRQLEARAIDRLRQLAGLITAGDLRRQGAKGKGS